MIFVDVYDCIGVGKLPLVLFLSLLWFGWSWKTSSLWWGSNALRLLMVCGSMCVLEWVFI